MVFKNFNELVLNGRTPILQQKRRDILEMFTAALDAVQPYHVVRDAFNGSQLVFSSETIDFSSFENIYLVGFGKSSVGMAQAVCDALPITKGVLITNDPSAHITHDGIEVILGGHPLPTDGSILGAEKILSIFQHCNEDDCVFVVVSGGGSSLFCKPRIPLSDFQKTNTILLRSGATIDELNTVRKHLSLVKGGQLAKQTKAVVVSLIISDVIHDPVSSIASGPTAPDPTTYVDAQEILHRYKIWGEVPRVVRTVITDGIAGKIPETLKEHDPAFDKVFNFIIANNRLACDAALRMANKLGYAGEVHSMSLAGEAKVLGRDLLIRINKQRSQKGTAYISSGEPTVTVHGSGRGGRNQEFVLGCVEEIAGSDMVVASFATDGIDGNSLAAGALCDGFTLARALEKNMDPNRFLDENNSNSFFQEMGDVLLTGLTGVNVMDIQIVLS